MMKGTPRYKWMSKVLQVYSRRADGLAFNVGIFGLLGVIQFLARFLKGWSPYNIVVGVLCVFALAFHGFVLKLVKDDKLGQLEYWKLKVWRYSWLLHSIRRLIGSKAKQILDPDRDNNLITERSIRKNLEMLYEFYSHYENGQLPIALRISLFVPTDNNDALQFYDWHYSDNADPRTILNGDDPRRYFGRENSRTIAVRAWIERRTIVAETPEEIHYHYPNEESKIRSMIAAPVWHHNSSEIIGIICVGADQDGFFKKSEIGTHSDYIQEFSVRISMEMIRLPTVAHRATKGE